MSTNHKAVVSSRRGELAPEPRHLVEVLRAQRRTKREQVRVVCAIDRLECVAAQLTLRLHIAD